jgi:hypothetical protein
MTDNPAPVVIPYARFLECQERRRQLAADLHRPDPPTTHIDTPPIPDHPPLPKSTAWSTS